jgi:tRNA nucleotidyltransferase/poly(A) polymerase
MNNLNKTIAEKITATLQHAGFTAYFAGGCVRDALLGRTPKDYDVATDARPEEVEALFPKTLPLGKAFGVIAVIDSGVTIEVATFRVEVGTLDGRRPETVHFSAATEDAKRRDFTINGLFYDPATKTVLDYIGGREDLEKRVIRAIGDPHLRFQEDHLRMMRAIRFTHTLDFSLEEKTAEAIKQLAPLLPRISAERIEMELSRILVEARHPGDALRDLARLGLLEQIIPEMMPMIGQEQPPQFHPEGDVFEHTVLMLNAMTERSRELAYSVLLHDVGKPPTATIGAGTDGKPRIRFDGHAAVGATVSEAILRRLKLPKKEIEHIVAAIHGHMRFMDVQQMRTATLRKMVGAETFPLELELHRLDCLGSHAMLDNYDFLQAFKDKMASEPILPDPWINGRDCIQLGLSEGKAIGKLLKEAYEGQIENRFADREEALAWLKNQI